MDNIILEPTNSTPAVKFTSDGRLLLQGRSLPENVMKFYTPLIEWVNMLRTEVVKMDINLEYQNSASTKKLFELLKSLDANSFIKELIINWHYEADDEDALESGQVIEEFLRKAEFRYLEYSEAA
jgi:hypothetical protein